MIYSNWLGMSSENYLNECGKMPMKMFASLGLPFRLGHAIKSVRSNVNFDQGNGLKRKNHLSADLKLDFLDFRA